MGLITERPLKVRAIYFRGSQKPLTNRVMWLAGNFLVVAKDKDDTAPTWYNVAKIDRLEGVEEMEETTTAKISRVAFL